jgi:ABC-type phosphate transport system substrate-binding protein
LTLLALVSGLSAVGADGRPPFRVITSPNNGVSSLERKFLVDAFLKRATRWPNDELIRPVDLDADSPVRRAFSEDVLKRSVSAVKSYWQQMIFSGRGVPPPELDTDEQVVRFVLRNSGAVGYVSGATSLEGVKIVSVR